MRLRVLVDNNTYIDQYYLGEPAVSYYLEIDNQRILFDAGYSDIVIKNAQALDIDLSRLSHIVISHGHNDHTNGLRYLPSVMKSGQVTLIAHPGSFRPKWYGEEYIGAPFTDEIGTIFDYQPQTAPYWISENCVFLGEIPVAYDFEQRREIGTTMDGTQKVSDYLFDDTALVCKTVHGLFIITGCSHSGICNITEYARKVCREDRIAGIIGGFHLAEVDERLQKTTACLRQTAVTDFYPCHCVSLQAKHELMKALPVQEVGVGLEIEL